MELRKKKPDFEKAKSLISVAESDMNFTFKLKISEESANTIVRNVYECFRMLGEALLAAEGFEGADHVACIQRILKLDINSKISLNFLEALRKIRHNVNYYGYKTGIVEAEEAVAFSREGFGKIIKKIREVF